MEDVDTPSSLFCDANTLVLQIEPGAFTTGKISVGNKYADTRVSHIVMPKGNGSTIHCPLHYFQEHASLRQRSIWDVDKKESIPLNGVANLKHVIVTVLTNGTESECRLPYAYKARLLEYFTLDICHDVERFREFDCYAFASLLADVRYCRPCPPFDFSEVNTPRAGDIVAMSDGGTLPDSIQHWALCLADDLYLSKFGRSGCGADRFVHVTDLGTMMHLYDCTKKVLARPREGAGPWSGYQGSGVT